ncbi:uncharacterized protein CELE_C07G2.5 [Caenorhabditis elegans]|uniref:Uncharacterized protein n=1 Tax=Caenorhabditis elegans TaxID=6239 RepID=A0A2K5ATT3_CAEEL|nr:Uncharacterized protein CELE_C07G2.5 [Caenorhabditis elegans]SPC47529.2 Uncharacterized protein CELE_C07G2.5 [Caenorhabditis elegans]|eukprot:NP_001348734.2 Uncharacterized protein CELE_C07G2.5 [Caenorhabditis elegans]
MHFVGLRGFKKTMSATPREHLLH